MFVYYLFFLFTQIQQYTFSYRPTFCARKNISTCEEMAKTVFEALSQLVFVDILAALSMENFVRMARLGHERLRQACSLKWLTEDDNSSEERAKKGFEALSQLALVDILAALPMNDVMRMAHLGHERLRQTCALKWVTDRMSDVSFETAVYGYLVVPEMRDVLCMASFLKRLNGKIIVRTGLLDDEDYYDSCIELINRVIGRVLLYMKREEGNPREEIQQKGWIGKPTREVYHEFRNIKRLVYSLLTRENITYLFVDGIILHHTESFHWFPNLIFKYKPYFENIHRKKIIVRYYAVYYRPSHFNGRHVVDVIKGVCKPPLFDEKELEISRRHFTRDAKELLSWKGLWRTDTLTRVWPPLRRW